MLTIFMKFSARFYHLIGLSKSRRSRRVHMKSVVSTNVKTQKDNFIEQIPNLRD